MSLQSSEDGFRNKGLYAGVAVLQIGLGALMTHEAGYMASDGLAAIGVLLGATGLAAIALITYYNHKRTSEVASDV